MFLYGCDHHRMQSACARSRPSARPSWLRCALAAASYLAAALHCEAAARVGHCRRRLPRRTCQPPATASCVVRCYCRRLALSTSLLLLAMAPPALRRLPPPFSRLWCVPANSRTNFATRLTCPLLQVGTGVFAYPSAVRETGYLLATAVALFFFVINLYTMRVLNLAIVFLRRDRQRKAVLCAGGRVEYHELTAAIFSRPINGGFLFVAVVGQLGTLASMTVFVCDQIVPLAPTGVLHEWMVALAMAVVVTPLTCLRTTDSRFFQISMQLGSVAVRA